MSSWPISTPAKRVPTTVPKLKLPSFDSANRKTNGEREEDGQLRILLQALMT